MKTFSWQGYTLGPRFFSMSAIQKFFWHEAILVIHGNHRCQKSICIYQDCRNKGLMFTIKEVWDQVCSPINQFFLTSIVANGCPLSLCKVSLGSDEGINELLPIYFSSHQHVQHLTSQILLILIDFDSFFDHFLL